jgi:uncharacterized protein YegP (UPF0339 family)
VLVGRETGNLADAHAVRAEIVRRGVVTSAYAVERLERPEQGGQPEFRLIVAAADGTRLAVGEERYGTPERAHAAIDRIVTLLGRCAEDAALASRHLIVRALSGIMVRVADEGGRIVLDSGPLPTSAARAQRERELFEHGVERARYRLRRDERGWLRLTLHNADNEIIAWGEVRYTSIESARSGRNELIAWLRQLRGSAALREAHIERLPASDDATLGGYLSGLATLTARFDRAAERRNRFLDHLLARFGEAFANSLLPRFDPRADRGIGAQQALQHAKTVFLRNIVTLTAGRALAPDYAKPPAAPGAVAPVDGDNLAPADGFARRLALLLGINIPTDATGTLLPWQVRLTREAPPFLYVERDEPTDTAQPKANRRSFTLHSTQPGIVATLLAHGTSTQHYGERHDPAHDGADNWVLTFSWPGGPAQDIHRGTSREAVKAARDRLIHHLRTLASDPHALFSGEGFHVVEHVLLRPDQTTIDDDFYRQRVTLVFPDWPIRFQDPEFRAFVQRTVFDNTPAHLDVRCYWLGYGDMTLFERLHEAWRDGLQRSVLNEGSARPIEEAAALRKFIEQLDAREGAAH